jgi:hypothetical protein
METKELPFEKKELVIVVHNPNNLPCVDYHKLSILQGDLKITTPTKLNKLKKSIKKYGVFVPKFVWIDDDTCYIVDGHQTLKALLELEKEGFLVPPIPYVEIGAKNREDAGEKLLMINSRFADINPGTTFLTDFNIDLEFMGEIEIPELNLDFGDIKEEQKEKKVDEENEKKLECPKCGHQWILS